MALGKNLKVAVITTLSFIISQNAFAELNFNLREGATRVSHEVYNLHMMVFWICTVIGAAVFGVMFYSMWAHHKSRHPEPAKFHHSTVVELIWTIIPFIILITLAIPATKTLIDIEDNNKADVNVLITGSQWKWNYKYMDGDAKGIEFYSNLSTPKAQYEGVVDDSGNTIYEEKGEHYLLEVDKPLVIPAGKKVRFLVTAKDVLHSWFVPDFAIKQDAVPGFINEAWTRVDKPGIYRGQCAELCGKDHGFMPIVVDVKSPEDYAKWVSLQKADIASAAAAAEAAAAQSWTMEKLMTKGEEVFNTKCSSCHGAKGEGLAIFPALDGSKVATGPVDDHIKIVVHGGSKGMPAWKGQLTDAEIASVITFERNSWSNQTGDIVQPADIANK